MKYLILLCSVTIPLHGMLLPVIDDDQLFEEHYEKDTPLTLVGQALRKVKKEDPWL